MNFIDQDIIVMLGWVLPVAFGGLFVFLALGMYFSGQKNKTKEEKLTTDETSTGYFKTGKKEKKKSLIVKGEKLDKSEKAASIFGSGDANFDLNGTKNADNTPGTGFGFTLPKKDATIAPPDFVPPPTSAPAPPAAPVTPVAPPAQDLNKPATSPKFPTLPPPPPSIR